MILKNCSAAKFLILTYALVQISCSDFLEPVKATKEPTEYSYNYWLLQKTYLFEDDLLSLNPNGDSTELLYNNLSDKFTRYVAPAKSEQTETSINSSLVQGDIGLEYGTIPEATNPLFISRVYPESPAAKANVPRYGTIILANGISITGKNAYDTYNSIIEHNKEILLTIAYRGDTLQYSMTKENIYAPTVFIDTLNNYIVISITGFKPQTIDKQNGTLGELKAYLDSTSTYKGPRLLDLRNNPGGHVQQCVSMADLFIKEGAISIRKNRMFDGNGISSYSNTTEYAKPGDSGETGKFVMLLNKNSASCTEIFAAALSEGANIPIAGSTTYGKGIGQTTWHTKAGGLAIITNFEFLTPKRNSYNKKGIQPDFVCEATLQCGFDAIEKYYGASQKIKTVKEFQIMRKYKATEGAILIGN